MKKILGFFIVMLFSGQILAESTIFQTVTLINFDASANGALYFRGDAKWGASSCSNATYVQIKADVPARKELLSIVLAEKMAGKRIQFWGTCDANTEYFNASYLVAE